MDISKRLSISYYKEIAKLNEPHKIYLVQHSETGDIAVKKILDVYSIKVYQYLKENPVKGLPRIIDFCEDNGKLILIEEFVSGNTLLRLIRDQMITEKQLIGYMIDLCSILETLHSNKPPLIHRDIKPSNIIITSFGDVILLDFNAAKFHSNDNTRKTDTVLLGTEGYAAPEQYGFGESSPLTDIYSIGIMIKEATNNSGDLDGIIKKCTQIDPKKRYQSVTELKLALTKALRRISYFKGARFLPPGFRTMTPQNMVIATAVYILLFSLCLSLNMSDQPVSLFERIMLIIISLGIIFIAFDYLDVQRLFPLCQSTNRLVRFAGIIVFILLYVFILIFTMMFIEFFAFGRR